MTGVEVCREIRAGFDVGIIVLTALSCVKDKIAALKAAGVVVAESPADLAVSVQKAMQAKKK